MPESRRRFRPSPAALAVLTLVRTSRPNGVTGPNPLHHRIEHAIEVSDDQLDRMVAMDVVAVLHPDGGSGDWVLWTDYMGQGAEFPPEQIGWLIRVRDFVGA